MSDQDVQTGSIVSAMLLVTGTCIGGGMLVLPIATGISGFFPSLVMMIICWLAMTTTALLLLEASLWMKEEDAHVISMSSRFLGKWGRRASWCLYLFICYASLVAYAAGGGLQVERFFEYLSGWTLTKTFGCLIFMAVFGVIIDMGTRIVGRINAILCIAMLCAYFYIVVMGLPALKPALLLHKDWSLSVFAIPLLLTSFSFQTMVPSLTPFLKRNPRALRYSVIGGTTIALIIYMIWEMLILGIVPLHGSEGIWTALEKGAPATFFLGQAVQNSWLGTVAEFFAFFALVTSFLGIGLGLFDFLSDGLKIPKKGIGKIKLGLLIFIPILFFAVFFERAFLVALDASGGFGDSILNGMIPVLMVWKGRYWDKLGNGMRVPGGKPLLISVFLFFLFSLLLESVIHMKILPSIYG